MQNFYYQKQISHFRHWTRKSYAIFQSLKLQIKISTISMAMLLVGLAQEVTAQSSYPKQTPKEVNLDTLEVMGELTPELEKELARQIQVIEAASLELNSVRSLQDVLNSISQVDIRTRGNNDIQADLSIRGSTFDQVQVLLNGFDMSDPQTGHHSLNLPITFKQILRGEVLSGPGSRALGPNAYAGAVNFITPLPAKNELVLDFTVGDFGLIDIAASVGIRKNKFSHYFSSNYLSSKGYIENTDFKKMSFFYFGDYLFKKSNLSWQFAYSDKAFGANSFYTPKYPHQYEQLRTLFGGVKYKTKGKISTLSHIHYRGNADRFELIRDGYEAPLWYTNHNYHFNTIMQFSTKAWIWWKLGKTTVAANIRSEKIYSNVLGSDNIDTLNAPLDSEGYYTKYASRLYSTASVEHVYIYKKLKISAGFMYYIFPNGNNDNGIYPGVDASYTINNNIKIFAGINTGMRLPTFTDLYYKGPNNIGNPNLKAESQISYQLGSNFKYERASFKVQAFYNDAQNSIDWARMTDTVKWQPINITNVQAYGIDLSLTINTKSFGVKIIDHLSFSYSYLDKKTSSEEYQSHYVMNYLKNKFVVNLNHKLYKNFSIGYIYKYNDRIGQYQEYDNISKKYILTDYEKFSLIDIRISWKNKNWFIYTDLSNAFNTKYQDYGNIVQAGRWFSIGAKYKIEI
ncbi:MAG: TonB-dependent receptor [Bacteroidales bacterium]|nr:TonB-dependent receptor [Bacteroidales bacterium]